MPKNALAPTPANALIFDPYESRYKFTTTPTSAVAENVDAALVPALMRAHFPEYITNARATVSGTPLNTPNAYGQYAKSSIRQNFKPQIQIAPHTTIGESNSIAMERAPGGGYVGKGSNNMTTDSVMNTLGTMMHEAYHARMQQDFLYRRDASGMLKDKMKRNRYYDFMDTLSKSDLPSVDNPQLSDDMKLNEFLATVVPAEQMQAKGLHSSSNDSYLRQLKNLEKRFPEIRDFINSWTTPEKQPASFNLLY